MARYRAVRSSGLLARWEAAAAADVKADFSSPEFTEPMSVWWQARAIPGAQGARAGRRQPRAL
jgi:hypothetical protein